MSDGSIVSEPPRAVCRESHTVALRRADAPAKRPVALQ
jgi:hypothetical protein